MKTPLTDTHPEVAAEWHPTKNECKPEEVVAGSPKKVWWKCPKGPDHEWQASLANRTKKDSPRGCPFCAGKRPSVTNSLAALYPDIAKEWHTTKNEDLTPDKIVSGSNKKVWWQCAKNPEHEWESVLSSRTSGGTGCPFCAGKQVSNTNSLAALFPKIAAEWHPIKNDNLRPADLVAGSGRKVWWKCPHGPDHEWITSPDKRTRDGNGCPYCQGLQVSVTNSLASMFPNIAIEWHPTKNGHITPDDVVAGSNKKIWWKCGIGPDHEWQATVGGRAAKKNATGCPYCAGKRASITNSLAACFPELAAEWHPTKNGNLTPADVVAGSNQKVWWKCPKGPDHEWRGPLSGRTHAGRGCPYCVGQKVSVTNSLASRFPDVAAQWHPAKNANLAPEQVVAGTDQVVWWQCPNGPDHEWETPVKNRTTGKSGCPFCSGRKASVTNSLASQFPDIAAEWHPTKNGDLAPDQISAGTHQKVWWKCAKGPEHEWQTSVVERSAGSGCPFCSGHQVSSSNSLKSLYPEVASQWHPTRNGELKPDQISAKSHKNVWWKCPDGPDHEWEAPPSNRTRNVEGGCPYCRGLRVSVTNSLSARFPEIAAEWHPTKNGELTPHDIVAGSGRKVWWQCRENSDHIWPATLNNRTSATGMKGCPYCNQGWTLEAIRVFVTSLKDHLQTFSPAELYLLFQQSGILQTMGRSRTFVKALATGRFPKEEIDKFVNGDPSLVDHFVEDPNQSLEALESAKDDDTAKDDPSDRADELVEEVETDEEHQLPVVETKDVLGSLNLNVISSADEEAVEFLIASGVAKIWKHAYGDEAAAVKQAGEFSTEGYADQVKQRFLDEYRQVNELAIPDGYAFRLNGKLTPPNLMQRHFAVRVRERKRVGNWSGTGAGKTLAAILATRIVDSRLTIICCPNSVVGTVGNGWRSAILDIFPDSIVAAKTFDPDWPTPSPQPSPPRGEGVGNGNRYLILNYEMFQQPDSAQWVRSLVERELIDFIIVDEIHYAKQRSEDMSQRRRLITALTAAAAEKNPDLHVLGMSATPVINNLQEGRSMVELVTGLAHEELNTRSTVPNCMALHQRLVTLGIRWVPEYQYGYEQREIEVDCAPFLDDIRALDHKGSPLALEQILTRARLPVIREHIEPKTLIYTHYVSGIDRELRDALAQDGWKVGFFTGDDKSGLDGFLDGDVDVLIGSSAIGTGVDGLQQVCNRLIVNVLPWTAAEFEQLKGRIFRQGQRRESVTMIIPFTYAEINGQRWSWCESKMQRLHFKKSIADAAVDGVVPEGHLRTPAQAFQDVMAWLERLETGEMAVITRQAIVVPLPDTNPADVERRRRRYGDFSAMNRTWNQSRSETTHDRLQKNPEEWANYHTLYREARKDWAVVPYEEMIRWCQQRSGYVIGDLGCGEAKLAEAISDRHTVHSFDHVAVNDDVVACDMAHLPLEDDILDVAIFSLSLMGANLTDYVREAYRTLKLDGHLHVIDATSRFNDRDEFVKGLEGLGFAVVTVEDKWKFTHIRALKTEREPKDDVELRF